MPKYRSHVCRNTFLGTSLVTVLVIGLTSCGVDDPGPDDKRKRVVTTFTVLADMARSVAGDKVVVESITKPGTEIHSYEPTPGDLLRGARADLIMDNGLGLEAWFEQFLERSEAPHVTLSEGIEPIAIGNLTSKANPHAWMSPRNAIRYVANIRDALVRLDPAHADTFRANADAYSRRIEAIDHSLRAELGTVADHQRALVTCEGAFSYLARDASLREAYLWPVNSATQATPQQIKATTRFVRDRGVPTVFCESTVRDAGQRQVAEETGARLGDTLYVDSLSGPDGPVPTYLDLLRHDAESITAGLTGVPR